MMRVTDLAAEYGLTEDVLRKGCDQLGVLISADDEVDQAALRRAVDARRAARSPAATEAVADVPSSAPRLRVDSEHDVALVNETADTAPYVRATPALFAGVALVAAFFMPLASGFGGLLSLSSWGYLRLVRDFHDSFTVGNWLVVAALLIGALLGVAVVVTEALDKRNRLLLLAAAIDPIGLIVYVVVQGASVNDLGHADIAGYVAVAGSIVLICTGLGVFDRGSRALRTGVFIVCGLLVLAGIGVPAVTNSIKSDFGQMFQGFPTELNDADNFSTPAL